MAQAYTHMGPRKMLLNFAGSRIDELSRTVRDRKPEIAMYESVLSLEVFKHDIGVRKFVQDQIEAIKKVISNCESEVLIWERIRASQDPCRKCGGFGEYRVTISQDESERTTCDACSGSGRATQNELVGASR